jgi:hypothetical protein
MNVVTDLLLSTTESVFYPAPALVLARKCISDRLDARVDIESPD